MQIDDFKTTAFKIQFANGLRKKRISVFFRWLKWRQDASDRVLVDAAALIEQFGEGAFGEARMRAIDALRRKSGDLHWSKVRREIGRRTGRAYLDTATRYLEEQ